LLLSLKKNVLLSIVMADAIADIELCLDHPPKYCRSNKIQINLTRTVYSTCSIVPGTVIERAPRTTDAVSRE
jgi:hypothetical protein